MRTWRAGFMIWAWAALLAAPTVAAAQAVAAPGKTVPVDIELVLAVDVSRSIDADEFELQRQGYARAIVSPAVLSAIQTGSIGAIAVTYVEWSGADQQRTVVDWTLVRDQGSAQDFAAAILAAPRSFAAYTSISGAIDYSAGLIRDSGYRALRQVIDVSGDGANNDGRPVTTARDEALAAGITINGLPIVEVEPGLDAYYRENVIGGRDAFTIVAQNLGSFADAVMRKLLIEVASAPRSGRRARG